MNITLKTFEDSMTQIELLLTRSVPATLIIILQDSP